MIDLDDLERKVRAADSPGPWHHDVDDEGLITTSDGCGIALVKYHANIRTVQRTGEQYSHADADFIAACDPTTIMELISLARKATSNETK